jgi:predicted secreted Zn-dependent protease
MRGLRAAAAELDVLHHLRPAACQQLQADAERAIAAVVQRYAESDREYDARTLHGARQGTTLVIGPRRIAIDTTYRDTVP